jgi:hypothetical protein
MHGAALGEFRHGSSGEQRHATQICARIGKGQGSRDRREIRRGNGGVYLAADAAGEVGGRFAAGGRASNPREGGGSEAGDEREATERVGWRERWVINSGELREI